MAAPTQVTETQYGFADQLAPFANNLLEDTSKLTDSNQNPYMQYQGNRQAQFTPLQMQAFESAALQAPAYQNQAATGLAGLAANKALGMQYNPSNFTAGQVNAPRLNDFEMGSPGNVNVPQLNDFQMGSPGNVNVPQLNDFQMQNPGNLTTGNFIDQGQAASYMNPYQQQVTDIQKREAQRQAGIASTQRGAQAAGAGAFGGSRQAIMDAEAARNLGTQMNDIQAQGSNAAYQQAMAQFNADQARALQAAQANQQTGYNVGNTNLQSMLNTQQLGANQSLQAQQANQQMGYNVGNTNLQSMLNTQQFGANQSLQAQQANQQMGYNVNNANLQAKLGVQQLGSGQSLQAQQANQQAGNAMNQLNEQSAQYGAGLGLQGATTALQGANTLGQLGQNQYAQETGITNMQNQYGTQQQGQVQTGLNNQYQDYLNAQNYPYKQLGFMSDMLRGLPLTANSSSIYQAAPSMVSQVAGLGTAALGASQLMKADGGMIKSSYADGGAVDRPVYAHAFDNGSGMARGGRVKGHGLVDLALSRMA
jgi:hypothetical protein